MNNKPLLTTVIATLLMALLSFLRFTPDPQVVSDAVAYADQAKEAISMKNWINAGQALIGLGALLYVFLTGKKVNTRASTLLILFAATLTLSMLTRLQQIRPTARYYGPPVTKCKVVSMRHYYQLPTSFLTGRNVARLC